MAHTEHVLDRITDWHERQKIQTFFDNPVPKICNGWTVTADIDSFAGSMLDNNGLIWYSHLPHKHAQSPISGRICNVSKVFPQKEDENSREYKDRNGKIALECIQDLQAMGCVAGLAMHNYNSSGSIESHLLLTTPHVIAFGDKTTPEYRRQIRGGGLFIAYLLAKQYATEDEVVAAFGQAYLEEAQKPDIQQLVADCISNGRENIEPLPDAEIFSGSRSTGVSQPIVGK